MGECDNIVDKPVILVIDDDPMLRFLAREILEVAGFDVQDASDGAQALEALAQSRPDMLLLDVNMPKVDGFTVCATLREMPGAAHIPVIMMTSLADVEAINRAYEVGATDFITQPINWTILSQRVRYIWRASRALDAALLNEAFLASAQRVVRLGHWYIDLQTDIASCSM